MDTDETPGISNVWIIVIVVIIFLLAFYSTRIVNNSEKMNNNVYSAEFETLIADIESRQKV
jgi:hypothetical protein